MKALPPSSRLYGLSPTAIRSVLQTAQALELGRVDEADRSIVGVLALYPDHPEALRLLAGIQSLRGQSEDAVASMRRAVAQRPDDALYHNTLGTAFLANDDFDAAIASLRRACELDPKLAIAWYNLGLTLTRCVRPDEAAAALRRAVALSPKQVSARGMLADMLKASGRIEESIGEYRQVLAQQAYAGMAWWGLADIKTVKFGDADIERIGKAMQHPSASDDDLIAMGFALAKALDDHGRYAESLAALAQANSLARKRQRWNAPAHSAQVERILAAFTPPPVPALGTQGEEVVFIVSMPRSGSTLIEQILASHSQLEGAGELPDLPVVLTEESQRRGQALAQWAPAMQPEEWQHLGRRYLERTAHWREQRPRFTDKLPGNWLYVGAVRAMLPGARIVICRRDPLETCLSCYRQRLASNEYTRTFADLAAQWRDFDRSARHWQALHPSHVMVNDYERLVADPETQIRALLTFCDLPFERACLEFHKTERDVHSPSAAQVREPLRRDTARAARYGALLDPLRSALGMPPFAL
jgi:tetratricopeptide (TPR) repeat protein